MYTPKSDSDWLLDALRWCIKMALATFVLIVILGVLADFVTVSLDVYSAELNAKKDASRIYDMHCNSVARANGISATVLQECARQRVVIERNVWLQVYHTSAEHLAEHIPGVAYCRSRPDMCALSLIKFLDLMVVLCYWVPLIFGSALLWYLWPVIAGMCLRRATQSLQTHKPAPPMPDSVDKTD